MPLAFDQRVITFIIWDAEINFHRVIAGRESGFTDHWIKERLAIETSQRTITRLIMVDDFGYQDLSCFGHPQICTPVLDKLADERARLTDFPEMIDTMRTRAEVLMTEIRAGKILPTVKT